MKKQAIIILAHAFKENIELLLKQLDYKYFDIFLHIDKKSNLQIDSFENINKKSKIYIFKEVKVYWGSVSQTNVELFMFEQVIKSKEDYSYVHVISGIDFPLKSNDYIFEYFNNSKGDYIDYWELPKEEYNKLLHYYNFYEVSSNRKIAVFLSKLFLIIQKILFIRRKKTFEFLPLKSHNWLSLTKISVEYLVKNKERIIKYYKWTSCSDELFVPTFLYANGLLNDCNKKNTRLIDFKRGNPYLFKEEDLEEVLKSDALFGRKINVCNNKLPLLIKERLEKR